MITNLRRLLQTLSCLLVAVFWMPAIAGDEAEYHLTGVIGSDVGKAFAVIEQADGQQKLLGEGDAIDDGHVKSISTQSKSVILVLPSGEVLLNLLGSGRVDDYREEYSIQDYNGEVERRSVDPVTAHNLQELSRDGESVAEKELAVLLNDLLGLPRQARIAAYNEQEVVSARDLLQQIASRAETGGHLGVISVSDEQGRRRVYLHLNPDAAQP